MPEIYDLVVLGGGPGGYVAAIRASQLGLKTALVEADGLGGVCTNWGCIPTKTLLKSAEVYETVRRADRYGINVSNAEVDWGAVVARSRDVANRLAKGVAFLLNKYNVNSITGFGVLKSASEIEVQLKDGSTQTLTAKSIILATGARAKYFPGMEPDGKRVITAREAMVLPQVPKSIAIIGAGAIGIEFAYLYSVFGSTVTLIEMEQQILPAEDAEIAKELARQFKKRKIKLLTGTRVAGLIRQKTQVKVHTSGEEVVAEYVLLAVGVTGNVENMGLEEAGVSHSDGAIQVNEQLETTVAGISAVGDVIGPPWLAHVASKEGIFVAERLAGKKPQPLDYGNIPGCVYCRPAVASVGFTEQAAVAAGYSVKVGKYPFRALGKAVAAGEIDGFVKLVFDAGVGELLGAHIIGEGATDLISETVLARTLETTHREIIHTVHPHPTLGEAIMEAAAEAYGEAVNI